MNRVENGRIGVIGGGLAAACTLAARGYEVVLFEQNHWLGGKAAVHAQQGFRFDMGPTILTLPTVLARIFAEADRDMADYLDLIPLDPQWRCFYDEGSTLDLWAGTEQMAASLDAFAPGVQAGEKYRRFMALSQRLHDISKRFFFWRSVGSMQDTLELRSTFSLNVLSDLLHLRFGQTVSSTVRAHAADPRVAQLLDHFTQYVGSAPHASPAVLCGIAQMQTHGGIWYPRGGTGAIPRALVQLAGDLHVDLRTGTDIVRVLTTQGAVSGVETASGEYIALDAVVSNMDALRTYRDLLGGQPARQFARQRRYEPACSGNVRQLAAEDHRVRLEYAPPLPEGWCGKQHACATLARHASHPLLVFVDADVRLSPDGLARMAAFLRMSRADLISGVPHQETVTLGEKLLIPLIHFLLLGFLPLHRMRQSLHLAYGSGCGQLFMARREAYMTSGGHAAIRTSLRNGITLPPAFRRAGFMTDLFDATNIAACRMYRSWPEVWSGLAKNAGEGLAAPTTLVPATLLLLGGQVLPVISLLGPRPATWIGLAVAGLGIAAAYYPRWQARCRFRQSGLGMWLHPIDIILLLSIQWYA